MDKKENTANLFTDFLSGIKIDDIFDIDNLQRLQNLFAEANGVASIITLPDGTPVTAPSNFTHLCLDIIRKTEIGCANCYKSDAILGKNNPAGPIVQKCLSCGLWDAGASITVGGKHVANWLIGQVRSEEIDEQQLFHYADQIGADRTDFVNAYMNVPVVTLEKFEKIAQMLFAFANEISENAYQNLRLKNEITEREICSKKAQKSEATLQAILKASPDDITISDLNGKIILGSSAAYNMFEVEESHNIQNHFIGDFIHPNDRESLAKNIALMNQGVFNHAHYRGIKQNGELFHIEVNGEFIRDENGTPTQMIFIVRDITQRIQDEIKQKENEEKYQILFSNSPDAYFIFRDGIIIDCNNAGEKMLGGDKSKIIGQSPSELSPEFQPDGAKSKVKALQMIELAIKNGSHTFEWVHRKFDGSDLIIEITLASMYFEQKPCLFATWRDISERKKQEIALYESERSKSVLLSNLPGMAYRCKFDENWTMLFVSDQCYSLTGYQKDKLIGNKAISFKELVLPKYRDYLWKTWNESIEKKQKAEVEYQIMTADKKVKWVWEQGFPIYDTKGKIEALEGFIIDITERKLLEKQILLNNIELSNINSEKDKFFSIIAHDLRSPFTSFMGLTQILTDEIANLSQEEIQNYAEQLNKSASSLFFLLENLLEWARIKRGQIPFYPKPISAKILINNGIQPLSNTAKQKQISIIEKTTNITCVVDEYMITSTIRNIISNALKFTPNGGQIMITTSRKNGDVEIQIADNGIGMSPEILDKLFRIDEQTNRIGTNGEPSSGLGLILCKDFVERHEGKIRAESNEGSGTTFILSIPNKLK